MYTGADPLPGLSLLRSLLTCSTAKAGVQSVMCPAVLLGRAGVGEENASMVLLERIGGGRGQMVTELGEG